MAKEALHDIEASVLLQKSGLASSTVWKTMSTTRATEIGFFSMKGCNLGGVPQTIVYSQQSSCMLVYLLTYVGHTKGRIELFVPCLWDNWVLYDINGDSALQWIFSWAVCRDNRSLAFILRRILKWLFPPVFSC